MSYRLCIDINGLPKFTTNANSHWKARWVESKKWKREVGERIVYGRLGPDEPLKHARLILTRYAYGRRPDSDNLRSSFKHILDGLVEARVLIDDSPDVIGEPEVRWLPAKAKQGKIRIEVLEVA